MAVNKSPILKKCKSLGIDPATLGYDKKSTRAVRAGKRPSEYGLQLREKQKAKFIYGVLERSFRNYFEKAERMKGMTGENLMVMLESRLDNVIFRMGIAPTRRAARQLVSHAHFTVNGKKVNLPSYAVKAGDVIAVKESSKGNKYFEQVKGGKPYNMPKWVEFDTEKLEGKVISLPAMEDIDTQIAVHMIVELYSK